MGITNSNVSYSGLVEKYIGTAYDTVKYVADNMEYIIKIGEIDGIEDIADDIAEAVAIVEASAQRAEDAEISAEGNALSAQSSAVAAATSASNASVDAGEAQAAAIQTANDVIKTNADVIKTAQDVITTNANVVLTNQDAANTAADATQTALDKQQTQTDVVTTAANAAASELSKDDAEAALHTFQGQYLGASATPPAVDGNGDPLTAGDLYQDTSVTPNLMMFWNGTTWLQAYAVADEVAHNALSGLGNDDHTQYHNDARHALITGNPHGVTNAEVGLGNVDNTSDADKPVSTLQQTALDLKIDEPVTGPSVGGEALVTSLGGVKAWEARTTPTELNSGLASKENILGNPATDGYLLSSTSVGIRSWVKNVSSWLGLTDTPNDFAGQAGKIPAVNGLEDGLEFVSITTSAAIGIIPPVAPVEGAAWFNSNNGQLYTFFTSPINGAQQWVKDNLKVR